MARRRERGHTLLELTVAATLVAVLGVVFGLAGRYTSGETLRLRKRARASGELRAVVEYLRQDLARAGTVQRRERGRVLRIKPERPIRNVEHKRAWPRSTRYDYSLDEGRLLRTSQPDGKQIVIAVGISAFEVENRDRNGTQILIAAGEDRLRRQVTLVWEP